MYKTQPWTLNEREIKVRKSPYILNRESDLAISVSRVQKLFEKHKDKTFSNNEIAEMLGISLGTVSDITNRLEAVADIKIVKVRQLRSALSQIFQHFEGPLPAVTKERGRRDAIINVLDRFKQNPDEVFTREDLNQVLDNTEGKIRRALQILLLDGKIKLVGNDLKGSAKYQYYKGHETGIKIYQEKDESYSTIKEFCKENNIKENIFNDFKGSYRLFYSSKGILKEYLKKDLMQHANKCYKKDRSLLEKIFKKS